MYKITRFGAERGTLRLRQTEASVATRTYKHDIRRVSEQVLPSSPPVIVQECLRFLTMRYFYNDKNAERGT